MVVLDLNMPVSDGYEACRNILNANKNQGSKSFDQSNNIHPLMVALTSHITAKVE